MLSGQQVLLKLRKMIISGELVGGMRIAEIPTAELLGVSRQPIRVAFRLLEQEGLLIKNSTRGYIVREISNELISQALEVRGVLEGLAAKTLAEKGMSIEQQATLLKCIHDSEKLFEKGEFGEEELEKYHQYNEIFHSTIIQGAQNIAIIQALNKNNQLPLASANALTFDHQHALSEYRRLQFAHLQHCSIYEALLHRQAGRAEILMREHSRVVIFASTVQPILNPQTEEKR
ncbi:GntR family transcriptional regulator [Acinetobacter qingfengensis]|uniref:GntR family transcriptional regulator n=1 Tax=Acinetobacter qingfengensis TaxID=1262585 RepID=A0A1E7QWM1_9GAMM|nr:GntR family transcriptional regulator [Acinetobacter qingfengensis]KAA8731251.1 GntR family transcriptional regulator [Acinetobacter qingfengensis]OEY91502.1 GntR family transcriptional regulator [Acinetobacter qingfengensis]